MYRGSELPAAQTRSTRRFYHTLPVSRYRTSTFRSSTTIKPQQSFPYLTISITYGSVSSATELDVNNEDREMKRKLMQRPQSWNCVPILFWGKLRYVGRFSRPDLFNSFRTLSPPPYLLYPDDSQPTQKLSAGKRVKRVQVSTGQKKLSSIRSR